MKPPILRRIDPSNVARILIQERKTGFSPDTTRTPTGNVDCFLKHYTLGQVSKLTTYEVREAGYTHGGEPIYQATLVTVLSDKVYRGDFAADEHGAKKSVARQFLDSPEVKCVFEKLPPKIRDIRSKVKIDEQEKRSCIKHGASREVVHEIQKHRENAVLAVFRDMGYQIDLWDQSGPVRT